MDMKKLCFQSQFRKTCFTVPTGFPDTIRIFRKSRKHAKRHKNLPNLPALVTGSRLNVLLNKMKCVRDHFIIVIRIISNYIRQTVMCPPFAQFLFFGVVLRLIGKRESVRFKRNQLEPKILSELEDRAK